MDGRFGEADRDRVDRRRFGVGQNSHAEAADDRNSDGHQGTAAFGAECPGRVPGTHDAREDGRHQGQEGSCREALRRARCPLSARQRELEKEKEAFRFRRDVEDEKLWIAEKIPLATATD